MPSLDGRLIPAVPKSLALKFKPPTVAVVYTMKDTKSGRHKKYIHEIKINFEKQETIAIICHSDVVFANQKIEIAENVVTFYIERF